MKGLAAFMLCAGMLVGYGVLHKSGDDIIVCSFPVPDPVRESVPAAGPEAARLICEHIASTRVYPVACAAVIEARRA